MGSASEPGPFRDGQLCPHIGGKWVDTGESAFEAFLRVFTIGDGAAALYKSFAFGIALG